jgi:geranylgeranyl reductase family protein
VGADFDVVVVGAGPAGAVAATVLARAGARVALFERARFPRDKLCGDTVNPGALAILSRLGLASAAGTAPIEGMVVTGERGVRIAASYPHGTAGRAILRRTFDHALVEAAAAAGVHVADAVTVRAVTPAPHGGRPTVQTGLRGGATEQIAPRLVIAADGRTSRLARSLGLARHPAAPRRWAVGAYFTAVRGTTMCGEMHIRRGRYIGVAPLPGGVTNVCVVTADRTALREPRALLRGALSAEPELRERFAAARQESLPVMLGPLAVDCARAGVPGVLLAGDAAGFIDPMTGDGLRFALRGGELAARAALYALEHGAADAHVRLARARAREFRTKWRFNRALRSLVASPGAIRAAALLATWLPSGVEAAVLYAGDVTVA